MARNGAIYLFLDEGGDLNFSSTGTRYFTMTCIKAVRPFILDMELAELKYDLIESSFDLEYFHASEDKQETRDKVFNKIRERLHSCRADSIIVEKCKTGPSLQKEERFYPRILGWLIAYIVRGIIRKAPGLSNFIIITDQLPVKRKREAIKKAIKVGLAAKLPAKIEYKILHHDSKSCWGLQIADYINWAIFRKWERNDLRSHALIKSAINSEFDVFRHGKTKWY